jgi:hypothetical protein
MFKISYLCESCHSLENTHLKTLTGQLPTSRPLWIQENANLEDIVRFFDGYDLMGNPVTVLKSVSGRMQPSSPRWSLPLYTR